MIKIYNTATRTKEDFESLELGKVKMYVCGPTVYNYIHIGNARTFINFDIIRRYFMWRGFEVTFVQNITDVDDKIINKALEEGRTPAEVSAEYTQAFIDDMHAAGVLDPDIRPKATEEIDVMIDLIERLIEKGHAYESEGDVYFSVRSYSSYGALSGRNVDEMESGHRDLVASSDDSIADRKRDPLDFAVWKAAKPGEPSWDSPWGKGRPGWHCECSAMSHKYLGLPFDIHGGGADLVFPHHENETAQSKAAYDSEFARYWMHSGMLRIQNEQTGENEKMSKSLGNFLLLRDVLKTTDTQTVRMLIAQTHYRSPLDFSEARLAEAKSALDRIAGVCERIDWACENAQEISSPLNIKALMKLVRETRLEFVVLFDDDFNTAGALGQVFSMVSELNTMLGDKTVCVSDVPALRDARNLIVELMGVFGIDIEALGSDDAYPHEVVDLAHELAGYEQDDAQEAVQILLDCRAQARKEKNFDLADKVRDGLSQLGLVIEDTPQGARIKHSS